MDAMKFDNTLGAILLGGVLTAMWVASDALLAANLGADEICAGCTGCYAYSASAIFIGGRGTVLSSSTR